MEHKDSRTGFFGKLASHGDFLSRRLPPAFVGGWDNWLQAGLKYSRERLGLNWQSAYLCSPIWHFALAGNVCGEPGWAGVLMPSVDRVGRYFPLTVAYGGQDVPLLDRLRRDGDWYAQIEKLALSSLEEGFSMKQFDNSLSCLRAPSRINPLASLPARRLPAVGSLWLELPEQERMQQAIEQWSPLLADRVARLSLAGHALFWTEGSPHLPPTLLLCQGLPTVQTFVDMLAGRAVCAAQV